MVAKQNLTVYQGADYRRVLELKDDANVLMDLTGYVFRGQAKVNYSASEASFSIDFVIRDQVTETGLVDLHISSSSTATLSLTKMLKYIYDIEMVLPVGDVRRILEGDLQVFPEVTK
jgi:hypothetical protein